MLSGFDTADQISAKVTEILRRPFDLETGPLIRIALLSKASGRSVLILSMQHIISDAWSQSIIVNELGRLYHEIQAGTPSQLEPLQLQSAVGLHYE